MKKENLINIVKDRDTPLEMALHANYLSNNFSFAYENIAIDRASDFIEDLKELLGESHRVYTFRNANEPERTVVRKDGEKGLYVDVYVNRDNTAVISYYAKTMEDLENLSHFVERFMNTDSPVKIMIHDLYLSETGHIGVDESIISPEALGDFTKEYYPDLIDLDNFFKQYTISDENILVLIGESGLGKTKFGSMYLQYLQKEHDLLRERKAAVERFDDFEEELEEVGAKFVKVAYIKNEDLLSSDALWNRLKTSNYDVVVLDDLDYYLSERQQSVSSDKEVKKDAFISNMLSFSDGIFPKYTKFIISTNRDVGCVDNAMKRDGRLFGIFEFSRLTKEEALLIWENSNLPKDIFNEEFRNDEKILQAKLGSLIKKYKNYDGKRPEDLLRPGSKADVSGKYSSTKKVGVI